MMKGKLDVMKILSIFPKKGQLESSGKSKHSGTSVWFSNVIHKF